MINTFEHDAQTNSASRLLARLEECLDRRKQAETRCEISYLADKLKRENMGLYMAELNRTGEWQGDPDRLMSFLHWNRDVAKKWAEITGHQGVLRRQKRYQPHPVEVRQGVDLAEASDWCSEFAGRQGTHWRFLYLAVMNFDTDDDAVFLSTKSNYQPGYHRALACFRDASKAVLFKLTYG